MGRSARLTWQLGGGITARRRTAISTLDERWGVTDRRDGQQFQFHRSPLQ